MLSNLGGALQARFDRTGKLAYLDEAVTTLREAADATPADHPDRARALSNLGGALHVRFDRTGELTDLNAAVTAGRKAVDSTPVGHPDRAVRLSNLGFTLQVRSERTRELDDLDEAVTLGRRAVGAAPAGYPARATMLGNLARALQRRYERTEAPADLDAAITAARDAVDATPADHPDRAVWQAGLGGALLTRSLRTGAPADLDTAITAARDAVDATPVDHPNRAGMLSNLGGALQARFDRTGKLADLDAAVNVLREAATLEAASPRLRAVAATTWGLAAGAGGRWPEAVAAFAVTFDLLGLVAPRNLTRGDQEHQLADLGGLASHAAACCVRADQADRAVELFEQGRGILLGQALDTRTDLTELAERHPDLAERFTKLRDDLDQAHDGQHAVTLAAEAVGVAGLGDEAAHQAAQRRRQATRAFDQLIVSIRDMPGYAGFLRRLSARDLAAAAPDGPVVIVNPSQFGSHALILTSGGAFEPVPLNNVTPERVEQEVTGLLTALEDPRRPRTTEERLTAVLRWLWDAIADPVLDRLGLTGPPAVGEASPRLWWCLPGLLSFLPLHAAGHHDTRADAVPQTVADRVISSYTPTVRALLYARRSYPADGAGHRDQADGQEDILVVAMPSTPGDRSLPYAEHEADLLRQRFPGRTRTLTGSGATYATVIRALARARLAHFACHGTADLANPSASRLLLHDHKQKPLTVSDVARLRLEHADLAFLSACSTARPGTRLTDEAIHLASAFQLAGYRHVIGTLWPVTDSAAAKVANGIYSALADAGTTNASAAALHAVTRQLRDLWPDAPSAWASHIHSGL
jgi:tetratricopeptide (TPR) repeat protein